MNASFTTAGEIVTGSGCLASVGDKLAALGMRALIVTGRRAMQEAGITDSAAALVGEAVLFSEVESDPSAATVDRGRALCRDRACEFVIGLGGGSALDAGKAIAGLANETAPVAEFMNGRKLDHGGIPFVAIPTTAGTGSEATPNAVLSIPEQNVKKSIRDASYLPRIAVVDPELTLSVPPGVTAQTGMDALTQAIESYISIHATPLTEALSLQAIELLARSLTDAHDDGTNLAAREDCLYGSLLAGMALANARLGAVHGLAHPIGVRYGVPHGLVCAVLLPPVLRMNEDFAEEKFERMSDVVGQSIIEFV